MIHSLHIHRYDKRVYVEIGIRPSERHRGKVSDYNLKKWASRPFAPNALAIIFVCFNFLFRPVRRLLLLNVKQEIRSRGCFGYR